MSLLILIMCRQNWYFIFVSYAVSSYVIVNGQVWDENKDGYVYTYAYVCMCINKTNHSKNKR